MTRIDRYRSRHAIRPTTRRDGQQACLTDGLAIWPKKRAGIAAVIAGYYHDPTEVREAAEEAGRLDRWKQRHLDYDGPGNTAGGHEHWDVG